MKTLNTSDMRAVNAGGTSYYRGCCKWGCGQEFSVPYNDAWWCRASTKAFAKWTFERQMTVHYRNCIARMGLHW